MTFTPTGILSQANVPFSIDRNKVREYGVIAITSL